MLSCDNGKYKKHNFLREREDDETVKRRLYLKKNFFDKHDPLSIKASRTIPSKRTDGKYFYRSYWMGIISRLGMIEGDNKGKFLQNVSEIGYYRLHNIKGEIDWEFGNGIPKGMLKSRYVDFYGCYDKLTDDYYKQSKILGRHQINFDMKKIDYEKIGSYLEDIFVSTKVQSPSIQVLMDEYKLDANKISEPSFEEITMFDGKKVRVQTDKKSIMEKRENFVDYVVLPQKGVRREKSQQIVETTNKVILSNRVASKKNEGNSATVIGNDAKNKVDFIRKIVTKTELDLREKEKMAQIAKQKRLHQNSSKRRF